MHFLHHFALRVYLLTAASHSHFVQDYPQLSKYDLFHYDTTVNLPYRAYEHFKNSL